MLKVKSSDIAILVAYGEIIPKEILDGFPLGILNIHPSLLPKYRGSSPIQTAILNQDKQTGITIIKLDDKMDHGPVIVQETIKLNQTETAGQLHDKLAQIAGGLIIKILPDYIAGKIESKKQDDTKASYTKKLTKQDGKIDWSQSPKQINAHIRAMNPWPGSWTEWNGKRIIIWDASVKKHQDASTPSSLRDLVVRDDVVIKEVQMEGKKRMKFEEFLKGYPDFTILNCG